MNKYVWIYRGIEQKAPEQIVDLMKKNDWKAVCLCGKSVLLETIEDGVKELSFMDIFMDERYVENGVIIARSILQEVGNVNKRLCAKQDYELILRVAEVIKVVAIFCDEQSVEKLMEEETIEDGFVTDAYVIARYYSKLSQSGFTESVLTAIIEECRLFEDVENARRLLEEMLSQGEIYQRIYRATQPILIYLGGNHCYNILNVFAKELASALEELGERIEFYDAESDDVRNLSQLVKKQYKASIGFQSWILSTKMGDGREYVQDRIGGPKYNFVVDHPAWLIDQLSNVPQNYFVLTHDRDYQQFVKRYFDKVSEVYLLPPGGRCEDSNECIDKSKEIVFLGTYGNYREKLLLIRNWNPKRRHFAAKYLQMLRKNVGSPAEEIFRKTAKFYGMQLDRKEFLAFFYEMAPVIQVVMFYYREQVVKTILEAGLELHVYGESWEKSPFAAMEGIHINPEIPGEEGLRVLKRAKISLNVMAWHKDGFTERIADSMLSDAVVVSDWSRQLEESYQEEIVLYNLEQLKLLPFKLKLLLSDNKLREEITRKARQRAEKELTWKKRAEELLMLVEEVDG